MLMIYPILKGLKIIAFNFSDLTLIFPFLGEIICVPKFNQLKRFCSNLTNMKQ